MSSIPYRQKLEQISALNVSVGVSKRFDCVFCGHHNSLSVSNRNGKLSWFCFYNRCHERGSQNVRLSEMDICNYLSSHSNISMSAWDIPVYFGNILGNTEGVAYLRRYGILKYYQERWYDARYDPKQHRCVFLIKDDVGKLVGGCGRALDRDIKPKWLRYGPCSIPFVCGNRANRCIICEDIPSAIKISQYNFSGISILGTNLHYDHTSFIANTYISAVIALDKDASLTALKLQKELSLYLPTKIVLLDEDIKDMSDDEIKRVLGNV